jgi:hypothetical protein
MTELDSKKLKEAEWIRQHTLTQEQSKQLILNKLKRAEAMHLALKQREMFVQKHR